MAHPYDDRYYGDSHRGERGRHGGFLERAGDEVRSWFGGRPDRDRGPERAPGSEPWQEPPRWSGEYRPSEYDRPAPSQHGWSEREHGAHSTYNYGGRTGGDDWRWRDRSPRVADWGAGPRTQDDWNAGRWSRDDESRYDNWWSQRQRDWRYENASPRQGRGSGEARGIYEDDYGRVHQFTHRPDMDAGGGNAPMNFSGRGPKGYRRSDQRIHEDVCERLTEDWRIDASDVEVAVNNGDVTLSGAVHSREEKRGAEDLIERIPGVREVHNNLRVGRWESTAGPASATPETRPAPPTTTPPGRR